MYAWCMRAAGWTVAEVADGFEALTAANEFDPHAIVMDLHLPVIDGVEAIRRLKSDAHTMHIPIVACTGIRRSHAEDEARAAGCDEFIRKPCMPDELCEVLESLVAGRSVQ
jgi:two-component system cell cycle response regulator DivK